MEFPELLVIYRGLAPGDVLAASDALHAAGVTAFETTMDSPGALDSIAGLSRRLSGALVGAGSVRTIGHVRAAADAGASFLLSPHLDEELVAATKASGLVSIPGAFTPTEVVRAHAAGADLVKIFPVAPVGAAYVEQLRQPLPGVPLLATGGVTAELGRQCLAAGCAMVGVGAGLINADAVRDRDWDRLADGARRYLAVLHGENE
ncbi:bifunctional 4-hydroxy-2-oxoglutarate aldolase/2-dehydro-3-deoxy-phosphogluconate aldolase [Nonomuraea sp. CA-141351]|uniref:bifunctional 4-hydroxy-2-oxoglutarate aldolase/2-dehydro-3-deoxy-phosphogluconate aldolase n=1 Tax=Nonomuraea sp. CA-141351 TaxID=3239996 RepID=UPI003D94D50E